MVKAVKTLRNTLLAVTLFLLAALVYGFYAVPDEIVTQSSKPTNVSFIYTLTYENGLSLRRNKEDNKKAIDDNEKKLLHEFIMEDDHYAFSAITLNALHGWLPHKLSIGFEELNSWRQELTNQFVCKYFNNNPYSLEDEILDVIPLLRGSFAKSPWDKTFANYLNNTSDYILWFEKMVVYQNGKFLWNNKYMRQFNFTLGGYLKAQGILILFSFVISLIGLYILKFARFNIQYPLLMALFIGFIDALPILRFWCSNDSLGYFIWH